MVSGVVPLALEGGGAELDGGLDEAAALADRLEGAVERRRSGAQAVAQHAAVLGPTPCRTQAVAVPYLRMTDPKAKRARHDKRMPWQGGASVDSGCHSREHPAIAINTKAGFQRRSPPPRCPLKGADAGDDDSLSPLCCCGD